MSRPHVLLSVAVSVDGYIDDATPNRLLLSNVDDLARVDQVRAGSDAILVGAQTIRRDNPRLVVSSAQSAARVARGLPPFPLKVTLTASGNLDRESRIWHHGGEKLVYTVDPAYRELRERLAGLAEVVSLGDVLGFPALLDDLGERGVERLMVEGGGRIHTALLSQGLVDEIHMAVAPVVVGDESAPRFLNPARYPGGPTRRMRLAEARTVGDVVLLRYLPKDDPC